MRGKFFFILLGAWTLLSGSMNMVLVALGWRSAFSYTRAWSRDCLWLLKITMGITHTITGWENLPKTGSYIMACKHQSMWETVIWMALLNQPIFVIKKELLNVPIYGWYCRKLGLIAIDRAMNAKALLTMVEAAKPAITQGRPLIIFPQGTRVQHGEHRPYKPGVFALHHATGLPVIPVALNSGVYWPRRDAPQRSGVIAVRILPALPMGLDRDNFMQQLEETIETTCAQLPQPNAV